MPWDHIRTGVFKGFLWDELEKALRVEETPECGPDLCFACGPCSKDFLEDLRERRAKPYPAPAIRETAERLPASFGYRVLYRKTGDLRFLSHLDLLRTFTRAVARAGLPIAYSQGFHPMPRIAMGPALPVGTAGLAERLDLTLATYLEPADVARRLGQALPPELAVSEAALLPHGAPSLASPSLDAGYVADVRPLGLTPEEIHARVEAFLSSDRVVVARKVRSQGAPDREEEKDVRSSTASVTVSPDGIAFVSRIRPEGALGPYLTLQGILGIDAAAAMSCIVTRAWLRGPALAPAPERVREPILV
ncbi:MAG: TIGR03936 family radical SAM-associated protein [Acidobacteriota bacterium]